MPQKDKVTLPFFFFLKVSGRFFQVNGHFGSQWKLHWLWGPASPPYILVRGSLRPLICDTGSQFPLPRAEPIGPVSMIYGGQYTRQGPGQSRKKRTVLGSPHPLPHLLQQEMKGRENGRRAAGRERAEGRGRPRRVAWLQSPPLAHGSRRDSSRASSPAASLAASTDAAINIDFAVTHTPKSRPDLCQERSKECLSHSRNASMYLRRGGTAGETFSPRVYTHRQETHAAVHASHRQRQCLASSLLSHLTTRTVMW